MKRFHEWGAILVIVGSVLAFGGVQPVAYSAMEASIFLLLLILLLSQTRRGELNLPIPYLVLPLILLVLLQIVPLPSSLVAFLSPARLSLAAPTAQAAGSSPWITLSIYPRGTLDSLFKLLAYCGGFVLAAHLFDSDRGKSTLVRALIVLGCFEAVYGIIQYLTGFQRIFTFVKQYYTADATGTYINHNHFAGFLELVIPLLVAKIFYQAQKQSLPEGAGVSKRRHSGSLAAQPKILFYVFLTVVIFVAGFYSRSRMGIFAIAVSLIFMALLGQLKIRRPGWMIVTLAILGCAMAYAIWIGIDPVLRRYELLAQSNYIERSEGRVLLWRSAIPLIRNFPLFGTGLGTFAIAYRGFQETSLEFFVSHLHSDYLEFTSELGLVGVVLLFAPVFYLFGRMVRTFMTGRGRYRRAVLLGCIGSAFAMLMHTAVDFNLQIPANALTFAVILGIGYKAACVDAHPGPGDRGSVSAGAAPGNSAPHRGVGVRTQSHITGGLWTHGTYRHDDGWVRASRSDSPSRLFPSSP